MSKLSKTISLLAALTIVILLTATAPREKHVYMQLRTLQGEPLPVAWYTARPAMQLDQQYRLQTMHYQYHDARLEDPSFNEVILARYVYVGGSLRYDGEVIVYSFEVDGRIYYEISPYK